MRVLSRFRRCIASAVCACVLAGVSAPTWAYTLGEYTDTDVSVRDHTTLVDSLPGWKQWISASAYSILESESGLASGTLTVDTYDWVSYIKKEYEWFLDPDSEFLTGLGGFVSIDQGDELSYSHSFDPLLSQPPDVITEAFLIIDLIKVSESDTGEVTIDDNFSISIDLNLNGGSFNNHYIDLAGLGGIEIDGSVDTLDVMLTNAIQVNANACNQCNQNQCQHRRHGKKEYLKWGGSVFAFNYEVGELDPIDPPTPQLNAVPEPASAGLGLLAAGALLLRRRRR